MMSDVWHRHRLQGGEAFVFSAPGALVHLPGSFSGCSLVRSLRAWWGSTGAMIFQLRARAPAGR